MTLQDVARFNGVQRCGGVMPDFELWTLTSPVEGLIVGSTYVRETIEKALGLVCA